ncbi:putative uncharacterized protein [Prevotella sp. CAG:520]|nr:putative uncharacterized protein [Prevotella sp. CAG:520]
MKKITKFLDSVMGGIKRTCVAKALAVFAVASIAINSFAQTPKTTQSVINGVEDFSGLTLEQLKAAATSTNFSFADKDKVLFLYNVNTGKFLNVGGHWGTCASLHDYGKALWVDVNGSNFRFTVDNNNNTGHNLGYVFHATNIDKEETDKGVFIDRGTEYGNVSSIDWAIEPVLGDTKNAVRICKLYLTQTGLLTKLANTISAPTLPSMVQTTAARSTRMKRDLPEITTNGASSPTNRYTMHSRMT